MWILAALEMGGASGEGKDAFEELFRKLYRPVLGFFTRLGCPLEECSDLAQETFLRVYRGLDDFRGDAKAATWVFTIAENVWRNRRRQATAAKRDADEVPLPENEAAPVTSPAGSLEHALGEERRRYLRGAIAELPPQMQRCVRLRLYQDMSYRDIAKIVGVSVSSAKSQVSRARSQLRARLAEHYPDLDADL